MDSPNVINKGPAKAENMEDDSIRYGQEWFFSFKKWMVLEANGVDQLLLD